MSKIQVLIIWILPQRLGVANKITSPDLLQKVKLLLLTSTLDSDQRICLVERRHIYMPEIQYTGHIFDIITLVVPFLELKILYSIRMVLEATINNSTFKFVISTQL